MYATRWLFGLVIGLALLLSIYVIEPSAARAQTSRGSSAEMVDAATAFLKALKPEQQRQASFPFDDEERMNWHYIPRQRRGVPIKAIDQTQRQLALALLKTGLSQRGFLTATTIMELEAILREIEGPGSAHIRDPELYFVSIFGQPAQHGTWGWRVEGHHLSLNFTLVKGKLVAAAPSFFGANPAQVRQGPRKGLRALGADEDAARALVQSLSSAQRELAIIDKTAPAEILTTNKLEIDPLSPHGIVAEKLTAPQRELLMKLIDVHAAKLSEEIAAASLARLKKAGVEKIAFAWAGPTESGQKHYYRIQGPTFLVEYDNTQNDANHIHAVWREFNGDFGRDLLHEHLATVAH